MNSENKNLKGISCSALKFYAVILMVIDHIGAAVLYFLIKDYGCQYNHPETFFQTGAALPVIYFFLRLIGRLSFPIFCFMLVEGFFHTRSRWKYAFKLLIFSFLSEVPFDMAFTHHVLTFNKQNVFFTLFIALMVMWGLEFVEEKKMSQADSDFFSNKMTQNIFAACIELIIICLGMYAAILLKTDYAEKGVAAIIAMYMVYRYYGRYAEDRAKAHMSVMAAGVLVLALFSFDEAMAFLNLPVIARYNGKRGKGMKYFFYIFYPAHLMLLYLIYSLIK